MKIFEKKPGADRENQTLNFPVIALPIGKLLMGSWLGWVDFPAIVITACKRIINLNRR
jgi:hypothetical protein